MTRAILSAELIHPAVAKTIDGFHSEVIEQVQQACAAHAVVVVGMRQNPFPKKACKALQTAGVPFEYLEFGSYLSDWKRRLALKMWTGWPTIPMVFVKGVLVGGAEDLVRLINSGELKNLLA